MKQNTIIILLTAVAVLLLVNLIEGRIPPTAQAITPSHEYQIGCGGAATHCYAVSSSGDAYILHSKNVASIGKLK
ncbi:MAG: hypothetical protein O7G32_15565 [SAR324 cluster bacterium]|nr:hypothetical protein [SAR324 cluster bacterium]